MIWKEKYRIGVPLIDRQHQELFARVTDFVETLRSKGEWEQKQQKVNETLNFMKEYVIVHFEAEEEYQEKIGYPDFEKHKDVHKQLINDVERFAQLYESNGYREDIVQSFAGKLLAWLINHVASTDQKIALYAMETNQVDGSDIE